MLQNFSIKKEKDPHSFKSHKKKTPHTEMSHLAGLQGFEP